MDSVLLTLAYLPLFPLWRPAEMTLLLMSSTAPGAALQTKCLCLISWTPVHHLGAVQCTESKLFWLLLGYNYYLAYQGKSSVFEVPSSG